jgi:uncharacterized protein (TIGR03437 family)
MGLSGTNDFQTGLYATGTTPLQAANGNVVVLPRAVWPLPALVSTSGAGFGLGPQAPSSIATVFGANLAPKIAQASGTLPVSLAGATATVTDSAGVARASQLFYVSPDQVNYLIPPGSAPGLGTLSMAVDSQVMATSEIQIAPVAPSLFTVNSGNLAAADVVLVSPNANQTFEPIYQVNPDGSISAMPITLGAPGDTVYVSLYGTGIRNLSSMSGVSVTINSAVGATVTYAGPQGAYAGLDQVNIQLPTSLVAMPSVQTLVIELTVDGQPSNRVTLLIQ